MRTGGAFAALCLLVGLIGAGCAQPPRLMRGDTSGAEVEYEGSDLAAATAVANQHCARYERVAWYENTAQDIAYFACVHR